MGRERPTEAVARVLGELAASDAIGASPAFAPERLPETARRFLDLVVLPMLVRALFGEDLALCAPRSVLTPSGSVAFFLAACGHMENVADRRCAGSAETSRVRKAPPPRLALRIFLLLTGRNDDPRVRLDPGHVVVDGDAARRVLGDDLEPVAQPFVGDRAVEGDDAILNLDPHARARRPAELVELGLDGGLDLGVGMVGVRVRRAGPVVP